MCSRQLCKGVLTDIQVFISDTARDEDIVKLCHNIEVREAESAFYDSGEGRRQVFKSKYRRNELVEHSIGVPVCCVVPDISRLS